MADRSVRVRLEANVEGFRSAMSTATKSVQDFDKKSQGYIQHHKASINELSNAALGIGASLVAASGLAGKAAMDWESSWVGVTKVVEGTDEQMASLEAGLRDMAKELPATHAEIAEVAAAAGQLGVAVPNIEEFTRTMIDLGEATNMTAHDGAMNLSRFMNIMGTSQSDVDRLGSSIVGLGNNFETTESEIVEMSLRLAGTSNQIGLTEGEVLGLATAMSSVGIEAQAGGTAMSMGMRKINDAVEEGGETLQDFANVAQMSAQDFAALWREDPAEALDAFVQGLASVSAEGGNVAGVLDDLGIKGIRESDTFLRLAGSAEGFGDAMNMGNDAFEENIALSEEAANRYETAESRIAMMRNAFVDLAIDMGGAVAPALADGADMVSHLISRFQELPDPVKSALGAGTGIAGMALLAVGGMGRALTSVSDLRLAMRRLGITTMDTSKKMRLLGVGSAVMLAITGLTLAIGHFVSKSMEAEASAEALADSFDEVTGAATAGTEELIFDRLNESLRKTDWDVLKDMGYTYEEFISAIQAGGPELDELERKLNQDFRGANFFDHDTKRALGEASRMVRETGDEYEVAREKFKLSEEQMGSTGDAAETAAAQQEILDAAIEETGVALDGTIEKMSEFLDLLFETGLATMSAREAQSQYQEALVAQDEALEAINEELGGLSAALNENKTDFDLTTEAGRTANSAFQDIAKSGMDATSAMADNNATQEELQANLNTTYEDLVSAAEEFGITGDAAHDLAREIMGIPENVDIETWMDDQAERQAEQTKSAIDNIPRRVRVSATLTYYEGEIPSGVKRGPGENIAGFAGGGYTGDGGKFEPKGVVHGGEWVTTKERTAKYRPVLESIHRGTYPLPGYANGGEVGASYIPANKVIDLNYQFSAPVGGGGTTVNNQFHNYNTDAVRATQQQVAQFSQKIGAMPVGVPG